MNTAYINYIIQKLRMLSDDYSVQILDVQDKTDFLENCYERMNQSVDRMVERGRGKGTKIIEFDLSYLDQENIGTCENCTKNL